MIVEEINETAERRLLAQERDELRAAGKDLVRQRDAAHAELRGLREDVERVRGYAQKLTTSSDTVLADHGRALLAVLDGGEAE